MLTQEFWLNNVWEQTLNSVANSHLVDEASFPYFKSKLISLDNDVAKVEVPNFINYSIITQHISTVEDCLGSVLGKKLPVKLIQHDDLVNNVETVVENKPIIKNDFLSDVISPNQTFVNFVVGRSNAQAHLAALTCASNLAAVYNPLFIYGNAGLGKTHLLNAIGNKIKELFPDKKIGLISGLEFVEGVGKASNENRFDEFKETFKSLDVLLVDDVQFLACKPKTHELFFSIFNELVNNKKQICITSDRTPSEISGLEERVISRFYQGLTVNIEAPEYETSINILKMKISNSSGMDQTKIDDEVLNYIATNFSLDVRRLEWAINRLLFYAINFSNSDERDHISLKLAIEAFKDEIKDSKNELSISSVRRAVCDYYNLTKQQITSANRTKNISTARQIAMYLCRKLLDATYDEIGKEFGRRDHSTVMTACENIENKIKNDPLYLRAVNEIEASLK